MHARIYESVPESVPEDRAQNDTITEVRAGTMVLSHRDTETQWRHRLQRVSHDDIAHLASLLRYITVSFIPLLLF